MKKCIELLLERRSVWFFDRNRDVNLDIIKEILEISSYAPSGKNVQPWEVIVVKNSKLKNKLSQICGNQQKIDDAPVILVLVANTKAGLERANEVVKNRVELGYIKAKCARKVRNQILKTWKNRKKAFRRALRDTSLFAMAVMISARAYGLETHPVGCGEKGERKIKTILGIENYKAIVMLICLGYKDIRKDLPKRPMRFSVQQFYRLVE